MINNLFETFGLLNTTMDNQILEMSVKQHQITFIMKESILYFPYVNKLTKHITNYNESYVTTHNDVLYFIIGDLSTKNLDEGDLLYPFVSLIEKFADKICQCPSLEYVVSNQYIKCFLDKPGLKLTDLEEYELILGAANKSELEMHPQRPYLLFINENYEVK